MKRIIFLIRSALFVCVGFAMAPVSAAEVPATAATNASPVRTKDDVEFIIGPVYANAPELTVKEGVPKGAIHAFTMNSEDSKLYPGIAKNQPGTVPYRRNVCVYVPSQYVAGTPAPFIVAQDGLGYTNSLPKILDNMIHERRLPAMVAIMINSGGGDAQGSERGLEYDTVSEKYTTFIETEVLPRIAKDYNVKFTTDPEGRATMGGSSGAACAFTMAWFRPDLYRRILSYSGTFVNQQSPLNPESPHGAWEYHEHLIPQSERKPLRVWLEVSENDNGSRRDEASLHNWVMANQRMAAALKARGYSYRYVFAEAAGHTDGRVTRQTLPGALEWLWEGYAARGGVPLQEEPARPKATHTVGVTNVNAGFIQNGGSCVLASYAVVANYFTGKPIMSYFEGYCRHFGLTFKDAADAEQKYAAHFDAEWRKRNCRGYEVILDLHSNSTEKCFVEARRMFDGLFYLDSSEHIDELERLLSTHEAFLNITYEPGRDYHSITIMHDGTQFVAKDTNRKGIHAIPGLRQIGKLRDSVLYVRR